MANLVPSHRSDHRPDALRGALPGRPRSAGRLSRLLVWFAGLPLHHRFALVGSIVTVVGMLAIGDLVSRSIEDGVVRNSAISSAVYMESLIAPLSQELATARSLSPETIARLQDLLAQPPMADRVVSAKLWRDGGFLAFSSDADLIGHRFEPDEDLLLAWSGDLTASFDALDSAENRREQDLGIPLLEVYNPIHSIVTGDVIARYGQKLVTPDQAAA